MRKLALLILLAAPVFAQTITELSGTHLLTVAPPTGQSGASLTGNGVGAQAHTNAWSGAVADTLRNRMVIWGGGHNDYYGNEVYELILSGALPSGWICSNGSAPAMCRANNPSITAPVNTAPASDCLYNLSDGSANDRHTYNGLVYLTSVDLMFAYGGTHSCGLGGENYKDAWTLNLSALNGDTATNPVGTNAPVNRWTEIDGSWSFSGGSWNYSNSGGWTRVGTEGPDAISNSNGPLTLYDPAGDQVFIWSTSGAFLWSWKRATNTITELLRFGNPGSTTPNSIASAVLYPPNHTMWFVGGGAITWSAYDGSSWALHAIGTPPSNCSPLTSAATPGLAYDSAINKIVGYPGTGNILYIYDPVANSCVVQSFGTTDGARTTCPNTTSTSDCPRDQAANGNGTATFGRFQYFPALDEFVLVNNASFNAYTFKLSGNAPMTSDTITITNSTGTAQANFPFQIGRAFVQAEIPSGSSVLGWIGNASLAIQTDSKQVWGDGSLKFAVLSGIIPNLGASASVTIALAPTSSGVGNTGQTLAQMLAAAYNFDAKIALTNSSTTKTASAKTMLNDMNVAGTSLPDCAGLNWATLSAPNTTNACTWARGPIATTVVIANHANSKACVSGAPSGAGSTTSAYDFGFDTFCALRPEFEATFWPSTNQVSVRFIGEVANTQQMEDVALTFSSTPTMSLTVGNTSPTTVYTLSSSLTMGALTRWTMAGAFGSYGQGYWINGTPPIVGINHNLAYLASTNLVPNYDPNQTVSGSQVNSAYTTWTGLTTAAPYSAADLTKNQPATGSRNYPADEIGPYTGPEVMWLYTGNYKAQQMATRYIELASAWPVHWREGNSAKYIDRAHTISGLGHWMSISSRATYCTNCGVDGMHPVPSGYFVYSGIAGGDKVTPVGTTANNSWIPDMAHVPDWNPIYLLTGDYYYLEESWAWSTAGLLQSDGSRNDYAGRGPTGAGFSYGHMPGNSEYGLQVRGSGWVLRNVVETESMSPDSSPEQSYYDLLVKDNLAAWEGERNITTGVYNGNTMWTWGNLFAASNYCTSTGKLGLWCANPIAGVQNGVPSSIHFWAPDGGTGSTSLCDYPIDTSQAAGIGCTSPWMVQYVIYALGRAKDLGYPSDALLAWIAPWLISQVTDVTFNPYGVSYYREATVNSSGNYFTTWAAILATVCSSAGTGCQTGGPSNNAQTAAVFDKPVGQDACATIGDGDGECSSALEAGAAIAQVTNQTNGGAAWTWIYNNAMSISQFDPKWNVGPRGTCSMSSSPFTVGPYTAGMAVTVTFTQVSCSASTYTISAGSLAGSGLSLNASTGVLSGTVSAGTFTFTVAYSSATSPEVVTVNTAASMVTTSPLPTGTQGASYFDALTTQDGTGTVTCSITGGSLSGSGLSVGSNCAISGTAAAIATYSFTITPTDSLGVAGTPTTYSLTISPGITVTSPANNSVVTTLFPLTASLTALPNAVKCIWYIDGRVERHTNLVNQVSDTCTAPKMYNATSGDEYTARIYVEAYDAKNALLATSLVNTFRINNNGVNARTTFADFSGPIVSGATTHGNVTVSLGLNPNTTISGMVPLFNVDGETVASLPQHRSVFSAVSTIDLTNGKFTVPVMPFNNGDQVFVQCTSTDNLIVVTCPSSGGALTGTYAVIISAPNLIQLAHVGTPNTPLTGFSGGTAGTYVQLATKNDYWQTPSGGGFSTVYTVDTTRFLDGLHRFEVEATGPQSGTSSSFTLANASINTTTGIATATDYPLAQGETVTCASTCPTTWTGTLYTVVQTADTFCLASSAALAAAGTCLSSLSGGSGTLTLTFTPPMTYWYSGLTYAAQWSQDISEFTTANGAVPCVLRTKYSKIVGIAGDTFTLSPNILNCDQSTQAAGTLVYSSSDATRATVNNGTGVVTLQSTTGHAIISVVDTTNNRETMLDVEVRPDRTTFQSLSAGHGLTNYNSTYSVPALFPFGPGATNFLNNYPFSAALVRNAWTAMNSAFSVTYFTPAEWQAFGWNTFSDWATVWNSGNVNDVRSLAWFNNNATHTGGMLNWLVTSALGPGYNAYTMQNSVPHQQQFAQYLNDTSQYSLGMRPCDEITSCWGLLSKPRGDVGSGQNGIGGTTLGATTPVGLISVVNSGTTATVSFPSWMVYAGPGLSTNIQISGATSSNCKNLNGPYTGVKGSIVTGDDDARGRYVTSFTITTIGVGSVTCNSSTDPGMVMTAGSSYAAWTLNPIPAALAGGSTFVNTTCTSNVCVLNKTPFPIPSDTIGSTIIQVSGAGTAGLNGYWRLDHINANSSSFTVSSVADGTYSLSGSAINAWQNLPDSWVTNFFGSWSTSLNSGGTGYHAPKSAGLQAGGFGTGNFYAGWYNANSATDYIEQNDTFGSNDRYGIFNRAIRDSFSPATPTMADGNLIQNLVPTTKPILYQAVSPGGECRKLLGQFSPCVADIPNGDLNDANNGIANTAGKVFASNWMPWVMPEAIGVIPYEYESTLASLRNPPLVCTSTSPCGHIQNEVDEVLQYPDAWLAVVSANVPVQKEAQCLLSPLLSSPDLNVGPGPAYYTQVEVQSHTGTWGSCMAGANISEETVTVTVDLSLVNPGGTGGPMRRWRLSPFGSYVESISPSTTTDTITLKHGEGFLYVSQATGTPDTLQTINVGLLPGAISGQTNSVVQVAYDSIHPWIRGSYQAFDGGTGSSVNITVQPLKLPVSYRICTTGGQYYCSGEQTIPAQ